MSCLFTSAICCWIDLLYEDTGGTLQAPTPLPSVQILVATDSLMAAWGTSGTPRGLCTRRFTWLVHCQRGCHSVNTQIKIRYVCNYDTTNRLLLGILLLSSSVSAMTTRESRGNRKL